jgi:hypothetical protein
MSEIQSISQNNYILHNIDAKKLYVQEPLFTANSGDAVYVGWRPDETVLYKFTGSNILSTSAYNLSEAYTNFEQMRITFVYNDGYSICQEYNTKYDSTHIPAPMGITQTTGGTTYCKIGGFTHNNEHTQISRTTAYDITNFTSKNAANVVSIDSVIGINRISGGDA